MSTTAPQPTLEQAFSRFRAGYDVAALAEVFDRAAPQLLLLASHVTPDASAAEDLLQETFLQAMRTAEQWDPSRPLLPWLGGILRHRAADLARRLAVRRPAMDLDQVAAASIAPGPAAEAEARELMDRVTRALEPSGPPQASGWALCLGFGGAISTSTAMRMAGSTSSSSSRRTARGG